MARLLSDKAAHLMAGETAGAVIGVLTGMALTRIMRPEQVAQWKLLMQINVLVVSIFVLGLPQSLLYFAARAKGNERATYIVQTMTALFLLGSLSAVALIITAPGITALYEKQAVPVSLLRLFAVFILFELSVTYTRKLFVLYDRTVLTAFLIVVDALGLMACFAIPSMLGHGLSVCVASLAVFSAARLVFTTVMALQGLRGRAFRPSLRLLGRQFAYSVPLGMANSVPTLTGRLDKIIMPFYIKAEEYAVYAMNATDIPLTSTIATSIATVVTPRISAMHEAGNKEDLRKLWHQAEVRTAMLIMPIFAACMAASGALIAFLYTEYYATANGIWLFRTYLLALPLQALLQKSVLAACGRTGFIFAATFFRAIVTSAAVIAMANWVGFNGPPIAVVATAYIGTWGMAWRIRHELNLRWREVFPYGKLLSVIGVSLVAGAAAWGGTFLVKGNFLTCLVAGVITLAVYIPLLFAFRLVDEKDRELIRHNWKRIRRLVGGKNNETSGR